MAQQIRVALVEDQRRLREGLSTLIAGTPGYEITGAYASMEAALATLTSRLPDVLLLDIELPGISGIEGLRLLRAQHPELRVLMLTVFSDSDRVFEAICAGASGYLLKDTPPARLLEAIRELDAGGSPMSPEIATKVVETFRRIAPPPTAAHNLSRREFEILRLLAAGHSYKTAAAELSVSPDTVRFHIRHIYEKLHVHSKSEAVLKAVRSGWI